MSTERADKGVRETAVAEGDSMKHVALRFCLLSDYFFNAPVPKNISGKVIVVLYSLLKFIPDQGRNKIANLNPKPSKFGIVV
jgi:hypothetical protein